MTRRPVKRHEVVQPSDPTIRYIPLTRGLNAVVDATDYDHLNQWNWRAYWDLASESFYAARDECNRRSRKRIYMHRFIMGAKAGHCVDHVISENTLDNRRSNLRFATPSQSSCNRQKQSNNTSGFKGVGWVKKDKVWRARIKIKGKEKIVGYFQTAEEAARAYDDAARERYGEFARPNFSGRGGGGGAF